MLTSCTIIEKQPSILDDSICDAPCWNGITVGVTTGEEMLAILRELPIVDQNIAVLSPWKIYDGGLNFYLYPNGFYKHNVVVESRFIKSKVANIGFCGNLSVSLGDVIERTGEPNSIIIIGSPSGGSFVTAINEDIGIRFTYDTANIPKHLRAEIAPEIPIKCLIYFAPEFYDEMLEAGSFSAGHLNAEQTLKAMRPWVGYGDLNQYIP
jgi:hypothetical protein